MVKAYQPKAIYLFGSHARGTAGPDSDYDLLLVVDDNADKAKRKSEMAYRIFRPLGQALDVLVWRQSRFLEEIKSKNLFHILLTKNVWFSMPLEPAIEKEVATWLFKATEDLRAAQVDLKAEPPLLNDSLFHERTGSHSELFKN